MCCWKSCLSFLQSFQLFRIKFLTLTFCALSQEIQSWCQEGFCSFRTFPEHEIEIFLSHDSFSFFIILNTKKYVTIFASLYFLFLQPHKTIFFILISFGVQYVMTLENTRCRTWNNLNQKIEINIHIFSYAL